MCIRHHGGSERDPLVCRLLLGIRNRVSRCLMNSDNLENYGGDKGDAGDLSGHSGGLELTGDMGILWVQCVRLSERYHGNHTV